MAHMPCPLESAESAESAGQCHTAADLCLSLLMPTPRQTGVVHATHLLTFSR
jgi:hypothetical protein